jgi:hypothetical protein
MTARRACAAVVVLPACCRPRAPRPRSPPAWDRPTARYEGGRREHTLSLHLRLGGSEHIKDLTTQLPRGLIPNDACATCPLATFLADACRPATRTGSTTVSVAALGLLPMDVPGRIYNLSVPGEALPGSGIVLDAPTGKVFPTRQDRDQPWPPAGRDQRLSPDRHPARGPGSDQDQLDRHRAGGGLHQEPGHLRPHDHPVPGHQLRGPRDHQHGARQLHPKGLPGAASQAPRQAGTKAGTGRRDVLNGTSRQDVVLGRGGNDVLRERAGNDLLCGGRGRDRQFGGPGRDRLFGGPGVDIERP